LENRRFLNLRTPRLWWELSRDTNEQTMEQPTTIMWHGVVVSTLGYHFGVPRCNIHPTPGGSS
jgi:hypothetical protein